MSARELGLFLGERFGRSHKTLTSSPKLSAVIPTYGREQILVDTIASLLSLNTQPIELVLVDQTLKHEPEIEAALSKWQHIRLIRRLQLPRPSIPHAMNVGLLAASSDVVLFLDDDIVPHDNLIDAHTAAHRQHTDAWAVAGQVLQPGEETASSNGYVPKTGFHADLDFPFWSDQPTWVSNVMAGNLSVKRDRVVEIGGFDERFKGVAYRFETEFARRLVAAGGRIRFEPAASIRHLQAARGGTRAAGSHLSSALPRFGMGDYYFAMRSGWSLQTAAYMLKRPFREVRTRFHLTHPWYIPVKLIGEARAFCSALIAYQRGPKLLYS